MIPRLLAVASVILVAAASLATETACSSSTSSCAREPSRAVGCGGVSCTGDQKCCSTEMQCVAAGGACASPNEPPSDCDDFSDCPSGQVCCATLDATSHMLARTCAATCSGSQQCHQDCECTGGKMCVSGQCQ